MLRQNTNTLSRLFGEDLFDDFFAGFGGFPFYDNSRPVRKARKELYGHKGSKLMKTDIKEYDSKYVLAVELPGFKKEDIQASVQDGYLTITAQKTAEEDDSRYLRRERYFGSVQRSFYLGEGVCQEDVTAQYRHGVLKLTIPKKDPAKAVEQNNYILIEG